MNREEDMVRRIIAGKNSRALQWSGNPYGNGYGVEMEWKWSGNGVEMEWKWGMICENRMDWIGYGAECRFKTI